MNPPYRSVKYYQQVYGGSLSWESGAELMGKQGFPGFRVWPAWLLLVLASFLPWTLAAADAQQAGASQPVDIEVFARQGCAHCEAAKRFLDDLARERPGLRIVIHDVMAEPGARQQLQDLSTALKAGAPGVPAFHLRGALIIGFEGPETTGARIRALLDGQQAPGQSPWGPSAPSCSPEEVVPCAPAPGPSADAEAIEIPLLHMHVTVGDLGLPLFTVIIGLLDGFNPCSMWVLILMLSMLATMGDRRRMLLIAGTFVAVEGIAYFAFMAAWLNLFLFIGLSRTSEVVLGVIAALAGIINLKDFWAFGRGVSLSIPAAAKPTLYARMRRVLQTEQLVLAVAGAAVLAVLVQVIELLCTSGFPALYTRILTLRALSRHAYYGYLLLYNVFYMLDDVIVLAVGVITLSQRRLQEHVGRWLKLMSGLVMLGLGVFLMAPR
jgi:glutaredoxin